MDKMERVLDKAAVAMADAVLPHNLFEHPAVRGIVDDILEFRANSNVASYRLLMSKLANRRQNSGRIENIAEQLRMVSDPFPS